MNNIHFLRTINDYLYSLDYDDMDNDELSLADFPEKYLGIAKKLCETDERIRYLKKEIGNLIKIQKTHSEYFKDELRQELRKNYYQFLGHCNLENSYRVTIDKTSRTVQILDDFGSSDKQFLLLHFTGLHINRTSEESIYNWIRYEYAKVYLIVVAKAPSVEIEHSGPTMTEIKTELGVRVYYSCPKRLIPLQTEIESIFAKIDNLISFSKLRNAGFDVIPFTKAYEIGGQNSSNRTGYGSTWYGGECYEEGTLYGEVSSYYAVGLFVTLQ